MTEPIKYNASPLFQEVHADNSFVKGVLGPVGSGKTVGCLWDLFKYAMHQEPARHKLPIGNEKYWVRPTRWGLVRSTYQRLLRTTRRTWIEWFGPWSKVKQSSPITGQLIMAHPDNETIIQMDLDFLALDKPSDVEQMGSLEWTGAFINEASELTKEAFDKVTERVGRYPAKKMAQIGWAGVVMDTNACDDDHWWYVFAEEKTPYGYRFWKQPAALLKFKKTDYRAAEDRVKEFLERNPGYPAEWREKVAEDGQGNLYLMNPEAENIENQPLGADYWLMKVGGKGVNYINVNLLNLYGSVTTGSPVYPDFDENLHVSAEELKAVPSVKITLGVDYGLTPACSFSQITPRGKKILFDELLVQEHGAMGWRQFSRRVIVPYLLENFLEWLILGLVEGYGDPAGKTRSQTDEKTCYMIANECPTMSTKFKRIDYQKNRRMLKDPRHVKWLMDRIRSGEKDNEVSLGDIGVTLRPAKTNSLIARLDGVMDWLTGRIDGEPAFQISDRCRYLKKGFRGAYQFERLQVSGEARFKSEPKKNIYSHIHDAFQYDCLMASYDAVDVEQVQKGAEETLRIKKLTGVDRAAYDDLQSVFEDIERQQELRDAGYF